MKGDRFGIRMSGIAADLVLKTGGEISRMRIGADKIGQAGDRKISPESPKRCRAGNRTGFRRFLDGPIRVLSRNGLRSLGPDESSPCRIGEPSRADCALSGYMRPESCGRLKFEIKGLWKRRSMKS